MYERFKGTCEIVLRFRNHREGLVRRTVTNLTPVLAAYDPSDFIDYYLDKSMLHLLDQIQLDKERRYLTELDRSAAFIAIGKVALVAKQDAEGYLDGLMQCIRDSLRAKRYI